MNREIKFRCWNMAAKSMHSWEEIKEAENFHRIITKPSYPVMQFIGHKDCNGIEIYEGDIVFVSGIGSCKVEWDQVHAGWILDNTKEAHEYSKVAEQIEMIMGNIFENPDWNSTEDDDCFVCLGYGQVNNASCLSDEEETCELCSGSGAMPGTKKYETHCYGER